MDNRAEGPLDTRASITAEYMALYRALESARAGGSRLFADSDAAIFLRDRRKLLYELRRLPGGLRLLEALLDQAAPGARAAGIARTKWIDDETTAALARATQLVLLGAGFDMRAYRLPAASRATVFELDFPETSIAKRAALRKAKGTLAEHVRYAEIDFNRQSIAEVLARAGFDNARPACFIWEGVTNYLTAEAVDGVLGQIRKTAPGNTLLFTYIDRAVLDHPERFSGAVKLMARLARYGEPWTFGLHPDELAEYLAARGFELIEDLNISGVWERAGRATGDTRGYDFYRLAKACVSA